MAKFERSAKGKKKKRIAAGFAIAFSVILVLEGIFLSIIWGGRASEKKKNMPVVISFGKPNRGREIAEEASAVALQQFIYASLLSEKVARFDDNGDPEEFAALIDETALAWEKADEYAGVSESIGAKLEAEENKDGYIGMYKEGEVAALEEPGQPVFGDPFAIRAQAADKDMLKWAKEVQEYYDRAPTGKGIRLLSSVLKTDTAHAAVQFRQAQAILRGEYEVDEVNQTWHINNCKTLVTTGKAAGTGVAILTTGGTVTFLGGTAILASGVDATVNYSATKASIRLGDEHHITQNLDKVGEYTGMVAAVTSFWTLPGSTGADKFLFGAGTAGDLADGKLLGGVVDVDADGEVKMFGFQVREGSNSKEARKKAFQKSIRDFQQKYKGKSIFKNPPSEERLEDLAEAVTEYEEAKKSKKTAKEVSLSEVPDSYLDKAIGVYRDKVESWYNEGMELMNQLLEEFNRTIENGSLYTIPEDEEYLYFPTVEDVAGSWDYDLALSNVESQYVEAIIKGIAAILPVDDPDEAEAIVRDSVTYNYDENGEFHVSGYMNIEPTGKDTADVTLYNQNDDGSWMASHYKGKMDKMGVMTLKPVRYMVKQGGDITDVIPEMQFDFYGIGDGRYMSGTFYTSSFMIEADVRYYGTMHSADEYWDIGGGGY